MPIVLCCGLRHRTSHDTVRRLRIGQERSVEWNRVPMSRRAHFMFLLLTVAWLTAAVHFHGNVFGFGLASALVWWGLIVMTIATGYYLIQVAPAARVTAWLKRDFAINLVLFLVLLLTILEAINRFQWLGMRAAGWIVFTAAALHPLAVDWPHLRHHRADPAGSPVPQYVPPACLAIDWTLAALLLIGLTFL